MTTARILIVGQDPDTVDFTAPGIAPSMTADKVRAGMDATKADLGRGHPCDTLYIQPDPAVAEREVAAALAAATYDVIVVGAGVRVPPIRLFLFEAVVNAIHKGAPEARIAFNTRPDDSAEAALRWVGR